MDNGIVVAFFYPRIAGLVNYAFIVGALARCVVAKTGDPHVLCGLTRGPMSCSFGPLVARAEHSKLIKQVRMVADDHVRLGPVFLKANHAGANALFKW